MIKYLLIIFLFLCLIIVFLLKQNPTQPLKISTIPQDSDQKLIFCVKKINENTKKIFSLNYKNIKIRLVKGFYFKTKGELYFERNKKLRMIISNLTGKQMDIGSNEDIFWFWSKYMEPPIYYFSKHQNLIKINLKAPLCPEWIIESMGLKEIDIKNSSFIKTKNYQGIKTLKTGISEENFNIFTLIDTDKNVVVLRYLCDLEDNIIVSVEYKNYIYVKEIQIPTHFIINWHQENIFMEWEVFNAELNESIKKNIWKMPSLEALDISNISDSYPDS